MAESERRKPMQPEEARKEYLPKLGRNAFYQFLAEGEIEHIRLGRRIFVTHEAMEAFIAKHTVQAAS